MTNFAIVISTYQRPDGRTPFYLNRLIDSIKNQTYQNYKIFLIGDKYENDIEFESFGRDIEDDKIYRENLPTAYEREKYFNEKHILWTCGGVESNNHGFKIAESQGFKYLCPLDHDDWLEPTHLENFNKVIDETNPHFLCSMSNHINGKVLPYVTEKNLNEYFEFLPGAGGLIKSSVCYDIKRIPLRMRNVYEETGKAYPSDADLWNRMSELIKGDNLKSLCVNKITCNHLEEGYTKRM